MEAINAAKLTKDDVDVRLKWLSLFHRYKHQYTPTDSTPPATVVVAVGRSDLASMTRTKQPSVPVDLCNYVICSLRKDANDRSSTQALLDHPFLSVYDDLHTTYLVSRFFITLTLKDQSILVNGDINEGYKVTKQVYEVVKFSFQCKSSWTTPCHKAVCF
ncbi:Ferredoxin--nitrite reductase, chloroplastic [Zea mays]|uniref:Ferredoxin--nitrite reductase, chloroplastic n=2 Tax=Zea mays TaxID=4577 RepID=A0A8J8XG27_MAIZE|nr:hypothetical protein ZEAMMB73_Zm00001d032085 [Zea mays]PWZ55965.1 Ferredoxin--nitrite reductase, chloroplastic [Zea mays]